ncbi:MAG: hypothetical protein HY314_12310 [Acidobacteria bacterium]|nr:hypothetical protein [Acidobacteriota bacterium]
MSKHMTDSFELSAFAWHSSDLYGTSIHEMKIFLNSVGVIALVVLTVYLWSSYHKVRKQGRWLWTAWIGLCIIVTGEILLYSGVKVVSLYFTPLMWTGYTLLVDAVVFRIQGQSLVFGRRKEFVALLPLSIGWWLIFELYNLHLRNWVYLGLPENIWARYWGYLWAYATILPAIFETTGLIEALDLFSRQSHSPFPLSDSNLKTSAMVGFSMLILPLLLPTSVARYLFGMVWLGLIFAIEPINYKWGEPSLLRDTQKGRWQRLLSLLLAGLVCGLLWEFWNFWAGARWMYTFPILQRYKIFEMPLPGYFGFPSFAVECYVLTQFSFGVMSKLGWARFPFSKEVLTNR